jgi:hypothetical protein
MIPAHKPVAQHRQLITGRTTMKRTLLIAIGLAAALAGAAVVPASAVDIIEEWGNVKAPPAPTLKPVTVDAKTTALLMLDFINPNCTNRPRCMANLPAMKKLLTEARAKGVMVVYSIAGRATSGADVLPDIAPLPGDLVVKSGVDKFFGTDLEKMLKDKGIQTVIVTGTGAQRIQRYRTRRRHDVGKSLLRTDLRLATGERYRRHRTKGHADQKRYD